MKNFVLLLLFVGLLIGLFYLISENSQWFKNWQFPRANISMPRL